MSYVITAFFGKYLFSDGKMGMMGCPNIYKSSVSLVPKTAYLIDSIGFMFTKCQNRKSFIYNKLRDFRESLQQSRRLSVRPYAPSFTPCCTGRASGRAYGCLRWASDDATLPTTSPPRL